MTISMPGIEPARELPAGPRAGTGEDPETAAAFVAALMAMLPQAVVPQSGPQTVAAETSPSKPAATPAATAPAIPSAAPAMPAPLAPPMGTPPGAAPPSPALGAAPAAPPDLAQTAGPVGVLPPAEHQPAPTVPPAAHAIPKAGPATDTAPTAPVAVVVPPLLVPHPAAAPVAAAAAPQPIPAAHLQVLHAVSPVLHAPDGSYSLELQLHPRELGPVHVTVEMRAGEVSIHLHTADASAGDLLRDSLPDLREQLEAQGLRAGGLDVGSGSLGNRPDPEPRDLPSPTTGRGRPGDAPDLPAPYAAAPSGLDIRL